jgi:hypothetical protein
MRSMAAGKVCLRLCLQQVGARAVRTNPQDSAGLQRGREEESRKRVEGGQSKVLSPGLAQHTSRPMKHNSPRGGTRPMRDEDAPNRDIPTAGNLSL